MLRIQELASQENCNYIRKEYQAQWNTSCRYHKLLTPTYGLFKLSGISEESLHLSRLYINTVKYVVSNLFYANFYGIVAGDKWPPKSSCEAFTMVGLRRLDNMQLILEDVIQRNIKGDFMETGVWKGGASIFAASVFKAYQQYDRRVFLADSFDGIPPVNSSLFPIDQNHVGTDKIDILKGSHTGGINGVKTRCNLFFNIQSNKHYKSTPNGFDMSTVNVMDELEKRFEVKPEYIVGFFKDSLPQARLDGRFKCFSVLRLDGDIYESTWQVLENAYDYLSPGGYVIIDDFGAWIGASNAVWDFREKNKINTPLVQVLYDENESKIGTFFMKPLDSTSLC